MIANLTEEEFSKHVNTKFRLKLETPEPLELELVEVKGYRAGDGEPKGMERFSAFFEGPGDSLLPQKSYPLEHDGLGEFEVFLVPIGHNKDHFRYEAVFNYFTTERST